MNTDRLIEINQNAYLLSHRFNQMHYDKVNRTIDLMTAHSLSYVSEVDEIDRERFPQHDAKVILHKDHMQFFARYGNMNKLKALADLMGFTFTLDEKLSKPGYRYYRLSHQLTEGKGFWRVSDLPEGAKPFIAHENGSLCTCYFLRNDDEKEIVIFRPNPNSKEVYDAFSFEDQIRYKRLHGDAGPKFS